MKISVIIATKDRPKQLDNCLKSVFLNNYSDYEVIVVDSSEAHFEEVDRICKKYGAIYIYAPQASKAKACNIGIYKAKGKILAFTDDDCIVPPNWLKKIRSFFFSNIDIVCVVGKCFHPYAAESFNVGHYPQRLLFCSDMWKKFDIPGFGANCAILARVAKAINGFDETIGPGTEIPAAEDVDFSIRILKKGYKLLYDPTFIVHHLRSEWDSQYLSTWDIGKAYIFLKHRALYKYFKYSYYLILKYLFIKKDLSTFKKVWLHALMENLKDFCFHKNVK